MSHDRFWLGKMTCSDTMKIIRYFTAAVALYNAVKARPHAQYFIEWHGMVAYTCLPLRDAHISSAVPQSKHLVLPNIWRKVRVFHLPCYLSKCPFAFGELTESVTATLLLKKMFMTPLTIKWLRNRYIFWKLNRYGEHNCKSTPRVYSLKQWQNGRPKWCLGPLQMPLEHLERSQQGIYLFM